MNSFYLLIWRDVKNIMQTHPLPHPEQLIKDIIIFSFPEMKQKRIRFREKLS